MFKDKTLLITGGTGSFGNAMVKGFLNSDLKEIKIFFIDLTFMLLNNWLIIG